MSEKMNRLDVITRLGATALLIGSAAALINVLSSYSEIELVNKKNVNLITENNWYLDYLFDEVRESDDSSDVLSLNVRGLKFNMDYQYVVVKILNDNDKYPYANTIYGDSSYQEYITFDNEFEYFNWIWSEQSVAVNPCIEVQREVIGNYTYYTYQYNRTIKQLDNDVNYGIDGANIVSMNIYYKPSFFYTQIEEMIAIYEDGLFDVACYQNDSGNFISPNSLFE